MISFVTQNYTKLKLVTKIYHNIISIIYKYLQTSSKRLHCSSLFIVLCPHERLKRVILETVASGGKSLTTTIPKCRMKE